MGGSRSTLLCDPLVVVKVPTTALLKDPDQFNFIISVFKCKDDDILDQDDEKYDLMWVWAHVGCHLGRGLRVHVYGKGWPVGCHYLGDA